MTFSLLSRRRAGGAVALTNEGARSGPLESVPERLGISGYYLAMLANLSAILSNIEPT
jgi:hypothetical protein